MPPSKKRKAPSGCSNAEKWGETKSSGSKIAITTYEDVADAEDEFHLQREKVLLDGGMDRKRRRGNEEEAGLSDEEILGFEESSGDEEEEEEGAGEDEGYGEEGGEEEGWGTSRKDYYNNDDIETEADALAEEAEALRLQKKKLEKMSEADFGFDESEWLDSNKLEEEEGEDTVTEVLKEVLVTEDMGIEQRMQILGTRYPEFDFLANELVGLQPVLEELRQRVEEMDGQGEDKIQVIRSRALAAYVGSLSMYFALLSSPAKAPEGVGKTLDPVELRDHAVMDSLLQCRELWAKVKSLKAPAPVHSEPTDEDMNDIETAITDVSDDEPTSDNTHAKEAKKASTLRALQIAKAEASLSDLNTLLPPRKPNKKASKTIATTDDSSDFGEEETMDAKFFAEKAAKKKSLRFYTSQIVQKASKRAGAGREAGGDADLPHRERLRDRQARLNAEAEKRGRKLDEYGRGGAGAALGGDSDGENEDGVAEEVRGEEDSYYELISQTSKAKRDNKAAKMEAIAKAKAEGGLLRVVEGEVDEDGKRAIGYVIEKNKGLAPKRKKEVRNPRVKKRMKFEEKKKKLASTRAVFKGGEGRGGYSGEKTGIKAGLVKSVKL